MAETIMKYQTSERCSSAQSDRLKRLSLEGLVCDLDCSGRGSGCCTPAVTTRVPGVSPSRTRTEDPSRAAMVTSRVDTVLAAGSTTQTIVLPSRSSRAETGSSMPGAALRRDRCGDRRAETEALRRVVESDPHPPRAGGRIRLWGDLPHGSGSPHRGIHLQGDVEAGSRPEAPPDALGQVDHRLADVRAGHRDDRLARLDHLPELRLRRR